MKLLIVDDATMVRRAVGRVFSSDFFEEVEQAADGLEALATFDTFQPDVVTLDITMPHLDGLSVLEEMVRRNPEVRVLVISALADVHTAVKALKIGAEQFICKPFTQEELREGLDEVLEDYATN